MSELLVPFLLGGTIVATVKFAATHFENPALTAIFGAFPTGLLSIYFLTSKKSIEYSYNYFYITLVLLTSIIVFYMIRTHYTLDKNWVLLISFTLWVSLVCLWYFTSTNK